MTSLKLALQQAIEYSQAQRIKIPADLHLRAFKVGAIKASASIDQSSAEYHDRITEALTTFFEGGSITSPKNEFKRAMVDAFGEVFNQGWVDGGNQLPVEGEALDWFEARVNAEFGHIDLVFESAKELRREEDADFFSWVTARADGYTQTLFSIYSVAKMFANKNQMLEWVYGETEHCSTCLNLNGQKHRASWYISRNYIPRQAGANLECGGYKCKCKLVSVKTGEEVTI